MTKNNEVEKIFTEIDRLISGLLQEATYQTNDWKENPNHPIKEEIERVYNHLLDNSQSPLSEERRLRYSFYELQEMLVGVIDGLPELVDREGKMNQELLTLLTSVSGAAEKLKDEMKKEGKQINEVPTSEDFYKFLKEKFRKEGAESENLSINEKSEIEKLLREILEKLTEESSQQKQLIIDLQGKLKDALTNKNSESSLPKARDVESEIKKKVQAELDRFKNVKVDKIETYEECCEWLDRFKGIKKEVLDERQKREVTEIARRLSLEVCRRKWRKEIEDALTDKGNEGKDWHVKLTRNDLTKVEYIDFIFTLQEKVSKTEIDEFGRAVIKDIFEQRHYYLNTVRVLKEGERIVENISSLESEIDQLRKLEVKDPQPEIQQKEEELVERLKEAENIIICIEVLQKLAEQVEGEKEVFLRKELVRIRKLEKKIEDLVQPQQVQIIQAPK